ncbi:MAG TPA: CPBP family intramembrane glutamic endopeptidase [Dehalococcoidia bacterium]|nr:CPBP family intramembrane glutamic endopeptidase [Dehalococcoidia bacterium]
MDTVESARATVATPDAPRPRGRQIGLAVLVLGGLYALGFAAGGEVRAFMLAGVEALSFALLALLAYLGRDRRGWLAPALIWLGVVVGGLTLVALGYSLAAILGDLEFEAGDRLTAGDLLRLLGLLAGLAAALLIAAGGFLPPVRRAAAHYLPIDPASPVHMIALVAVTGVTLVSLVPLIVLGEPPLLDVLASDGLNGGDEAATLRETLYRLVWVVPASIVAVGWGVRRALPEALARLGLVRPTARQLVFALISTVLLVIGVRLLEIGLEAVWRAADWPTTDEAALDELFAFALNPLGAVVVGVTAGLGEEVAVRGILQPRLGILVSNLVFTALHAFQYNWDGLIVVFTIGVVLGLVRRRTNTTTCAVIHGGYDFILLLGASLAFPGID